MLNEKWNHEGQPGGSCDFWVNMASKQENIGFLSHISSIYSTPLCRYRVQTYTPEPRWHTSYTDGLVWAVRLCQAVAGQLCVQNITQTCLFAKCTTPVQYISSPSPVENIPRSGSAVLLDKNDPVCFSIVQKWCYQMHEFQIKCNVVSRYLEMYWI